MKVPCPLVEINVNW